MVNISMEHLTSKGTGWGGLEFFSLTLFSPLTEILCTV